MKTLRLILLLAGLSLAILAAVTVFAACGVFFLMRGRLEGDASQVLRNPFDLPALMAAANICDELIGTRAGVTERRYTVNGRVSLGEGKIAITRKLVAAMAGALVVSAALAGLPALILEARGLGKSLRQANRSAGGIISG